MFNLFQLMQMLQGGGNPQQMLMGLMQQNPEMQQVLQGVDINNPQSMEKACRNLCQQKGLDYDTMVAQFKQQSGNFR